MLLAAVAGIVFAACAGQSSAAALGGSIQYTKSGGIAGIEESMKIGRDHRGRIGAKTFKLTAAEARRLAGAVQRADLTRVKSPKGGGCCDFFAYEIRYRAHRVAWDETTEDRLPKRVRELSGLLGELYERYA